MKHTFPALLLLSLAIVSNVNAAPQTSEATSSATSTGTSTAISAEQSSNYESDSEVEALAGLSVEQLINLEVTSAGKKPQTLHQVAAAMFVITSEDISRSSATNIPELLRMVPGLHVAQVNANTWAISSRGFTDVFSDKLLVLIDGRSLYTPLFSGVYWDLQDYVLEDIERIEVIRGPGASLWGSNAVNGVINIITKKARDTKGVLASAGGGSQEVGFGQARYGTSLSESSEFRAYTKYNNRDSFKSPSGGNSNDHWQSARTGFRLDSEATDVDQTTVQGDFVYANEDSAAYVPSTVPPFSSSEDNNISTSNANLLGRWSHQVSEDSDVQTQLYYDFLRRDELFLDQKTSTVDFDVQHRFKPIDRNELIWGFNYRYYHDQLDGMRTVYFTPESRDVDVFSWFLQDEIAVVENKLHFIVGSKFEQNDFTDFEFQPNARLVYTPGKVHTLWAAVSKAVRTPSRANEDVHFQAAAIADPTTGVPGIVTVNGNRDMETEDLIAYELGYRVQVNERTSVDIATFYNDYSHLVATEVGNPEINLSPTPSFILPVTLTNGDGADAYGGEIAIDWRALDWWRFVGWYSYLQIKSDGQEDASTSGIIPGQDEEKDSPVNQFAISSLLTVTKDVEFDTFLRYVDSVPGRGVGSYVSVDVRLAWNISEQWLVEVVGQNLVEQQHLEFSPIFVNTETAEVPRSVYGKLTWRY